MFSSLVARWLGAWSVRQPATAVIPDTRMTDCLQMMPFGRELGDGGGMQWLRYALRTCGACSRA